MVTQSGKNVIVCERCKRLWKKSKAEEEKGKEQIMKVIDEVCPKVEGDMRLVDDSTLWIKTDKWGQIRRVIVEDSESIFCKVFYEGVDDE